MIVAVLVITLVVAVPLVLICLVLGVPWYFAPVVALVVALAYTWPKTRNVTTVIPAPLWGEDADPIAHARLLNLVDGLVLSLGLATPAVRVLDTGGMNAMTVAAPDAVTLVFTRGLLEGLERIELEGVVAAMLVRAKEGDAVVATAAAAAVGRLYLAGPLRPLRGFAVGRLRHALDRDRDILADRDAVRVTRYPPGLIAALAKIEAGTPRVADITEPVAHLWLVPPAHALVASHPLDLRIDVLQEI